MKTAVWIIVVALPVVWLAGSAGAQMTEVDKAARDIYHELLSPFCPGQSLASCQSGQARVLRTEIRERLAAGESREAIINSLVEQYGPTILGAPPNEGLGRAAWLGPITAIAVGAIFVAIVVAQFRRARRRERHRTPKLDPKLQSRIEDELHSH